MEILHRAAGFKKGPEKLSSEIEVQAAVAQPPPKKQKVHEVLSQAQLQEYIPQPPPQAIQRVEQPEQQIMQVPLI